MPPRTTPRPIRWLHWITLPPNRIRRCRRQWSSGWRPPPMGRVTARRRVSHLTADETVMRPETVVVEEPLEIRINGTATTVTMRTPGSDFELAQGFLLTEGVITHRDQVSTVQYCRGTGEDGMNTYNVLDVTLAEGVAT